MKKIGFIGIGKLGLDCAEVMAEKHEVRGYDIYPRESDSVKVCDIDGVGKRKRMDLYCCAHTTC
jgi:UDP-N-acetyl-D-mannosaminuronate dehydrogenase